MENTSEKYGIPEPCSSVSLVDLGSRAKAIAEISNPHGVTGCCQDCACQDSSCPQN